jgi:homoserine dehydrogenase
MKKVAIIGAGGIATHLRARLLSQGINVCCSLQKNPRDKLASLLEHEKPQAVFLAISTLDEGEAARDYILTCIKAEIPIITCEKGALAYHAKVLKPHLDKIGFSATVGGGTRMLKYVQSRHLTGKQVEIHAVVNGTLNFIFDEICQGRSLGEACKEACGLGYAEPGATDPLSLINGELKDVRMKTCVFFNTILASDRLVTPHELELLRLTAKEVEQLSERSGDYRLVISFTNKKSAREHTRFGRQFSLHFVDSWHITGSFRQVTQASELSSWLPEGFGNAVHIIEGNLGSGGTYTLLGPGAGHEPTTSAMLADFEELCR